MRHPNQLAPRTFGGLVENLFNSNLNRYFDDNFNDSWIKTPAVNIKETESSYRLDIVAPGAQKEDFKLHVNDKTLTLSYEHKETANQENEKWVRNEFKVQSFKRSFTIGDVVDAEKINAKYEDGILKVTLPKKENAIATKKDIEIA